ncbi:MAG: hypothetical protein FWF85_05055 [Clostridiales bacterium]|nr:hypothetical protein [Clostridiales bacterium]
MDITRKMEKMESFSVILGAFLAGLIVAATVIFFVFTMGSNSGREDVYVYSVDAYFSNIRKNDGLSVSDVESLPSFFQYYAGATKEEVEDYNENSSLYSEYIADVYIINNSDQHIPPMWAMRPGHRLEHLGSMESMSVKIIREQNIPSNGFWVYAWLNEGMTSLGPYESRYGELRVIVKNQPGVTEAEVIELIEDMPVLLYVGIGAHYNIMNWPKAYRGIAFYVPLIYEDANFDSKNEWPQNLISDYGVENTISKEEILELVNNEKPANELIKTIYPREEIRIYKLSQVLQVRPPECVRYSNCYIYLIYKYDEDNYAFFLYDPVKENSFPLASWFLGKRLYLDDFEKLHKEKATLFEVQQFDPDGNYTSLYAGSTTSFHTYHLTVDGYLIRLDYNSEGLREICQITITGGENNKLYYNLLPIDRELLEPRE